MEDDLNTNKKSFDSSLDGILNVNTMDTTALPSQTVTFVVLSKDLHDPCSSSEDCDLDRGTLHRTMVHRYFGRLHLSMRPDLLLLGSYLQASWS